MKNHKVIKTIVLILTWLTLSPLLLILDGRWKLLPKWLRIVLFVLSPLMLIFLFLVVIVANYAAVEHFHRYHFTKPRVIERITGVRFPEYKVVDYNRIGHGLLPTCYKTVLEFEDLPNDVFYEALEKNGDSYIEENDSVRTFSFGEPYKYLIIDFQGLVKHGDAYIKVREGSKTFEVSLMEWPYHDRHNKGMDTEIENEGSEIEVVMAPPCETIETDSLNVYYPNFSRIDLVTGVMPDKLNDTTVVLCCEAAFTGECLTEFKHTNIAGDHVSSGVRYQGYRCRRNTGAFVWYDGNWKFLWKDYTQELDSAAQHNGMGFGQEMIIHEGHLCETIRKDRNANQFRALCEVDGRVCVIDVKMTMPFGAFKKLLVAYGVTEALYLDMGAGWNHSWYRDENSNAVDIYPYQHPYCTNWLTFY